MAPPAFSAEAEHDDTAADPEREERLRRLAGKLLVERGLTQSLDGGGKRLDEGAAADRVAGALDRVAASEDPAGLVDTDAVAAAAAHHAATALAEPLRELTAEEKSSLQLIILTMGRPALPITADGIQPPPETGGNELWTVLLSTRSDEFLSASTAAGAVFRQTSSGPSLCGTAWRVANGRLVTNRHVVQKLADNQALPPNEWSLRTDCETWVDFAFFGAGSGTRTKLSRLPYVAPDRMIDLAVLEAEPGAPGATLDIDWTSPVTANLKIYVVGHPQAPATRAEVTAIFGKADGRKRFAPGFVERLRSSAPIFEHDCSTLGGNSGSCAIDFDTRLVRGLHFGGTGADTSGVMGETNLCIAFAALKDHPCAAAIMGGSV